MYVHACIWYACTCTYVQYTQGSEGTLKCIKINNLHIRVVHVYMYNVYTCNFTKFISFILTIVIASTHKYTQSSFKLTTMLLGRLRRSAILAISLKAVIKDLSPADT